MSKNVIFGINGPVVTVAGTRDFSMQEMVYVGEEKLVGEVIGVNEQLTTIQVYEVTTGLHPGEPVEPTGSPMSVTLGPGILSNIFDGIERPLGDIAEKSGAFIARGSDVAPLDTQKLWDVTLTVKVGDQLTGGDIYAECPETASIVHKVMVPPGVSGKVTFTVKNGQYRIDDRVAELEDEQGNKIPLTLCQKWPIRNPRPFKERLACTVPLITGQRVIDTMLPIAKGGTAAIPGGFGTGKTMTQHQLAKWCNADIIIYVGCGERGNEMTQVLDEFGELIDPRSGRKLTDRTVLEEMPAEEGFPAYLPSRLSEFYERAGRVEALNGKEGSVTVIGAVSPQGSDFSEPVTQNTKRFTRVFWALDKSLAYARHYPAINWTTSYSEYDVDLARYLEENVDPDFMKYRSRMMAILREESSLMEIVKLIGADVLPDDQKLTIDVARVIRVGFLQQNAYHADDTYVPLSKQFLMMKVILRLYDKGRQLIAAGIPVGRVTESGLYEKLIKMKYDIPNDKPEIFDDYLKEIDQVMDGLLQTGTAAAR